MTTAKFLQDCLDRLADGASLSADEARHLFGIILNSEVDPTRLAAILTALRVRGETVDEMVGVVHAMRDVSIPLVHSVKDAIDVCGTGGDRLHTRNVSTAVAFVLSAMGVPVAKHGNRAVSSCSGATDVLAELGIPPDEDLTRQGKRLDAQQLVFLAAPLHIPALKKIAVTRRSLGFRTIFNLVGPACNPAHVRRQLVGVHGPQWITPLAETMGRLGGTDVAVLSGETDRGFADEITLSGITHVALWRDGRIVRYDLDPTRFFGPLQPISTLAGGTSAENAAALRRLLQGETGVYRDTVCLNAAVALDVAGRNRVFGQDGICHESLAENLRHVAKVIDEGHALAAMERARDISAPAV